jgi:hypothetical protein
MDTNVLTNNKATNVVSTAKQKTAHNNVAVYDSERQILVRLSSYKGLDTIKAEEVLEVIAPETFADSGKTCFRRYFR